MIAGLERGSKSAAEDFAAAAGALLAPLELGDASPYVENLACVLQQFRPLSTHCCFTFLQYWSAAVFTLRQWTVLREAPVSFGVVSVRRPQAASRRPQAVVIATLLTPYPHFLPRPQKLSEARPFFPSPGNSLEISNCRFLPILQCSSCRTYLRMQICHGPKSATDTP